MIPGDLLSAFPHRQFHTLPGLLDSWAALPNPYPNACVSMQGGSLYHFYDGLWYDPAERKGGKVISIGKDIYIDSDSEMFIKTIYNDICVSSNVNIT